MTSRLVGLVQATLARAGMRLTRIPSCVEPVMPFDVLELALKAVLQEIGNEQFYFVQIGAKNGILNDFLNHLVRRHKLMGCLVESTPEVFEELKLNYADQTQLEFRNVLIGDSEGSAPLSSFRKDGAVPRQTFSTFHHSIESRPIHLLYVDTEESGDIVLRSAFGSGMRPRIVHYEWTEMSLERRCSLKLDLLEFGYRFIDIGADTVCILSSDQSDV